MKTLNIRYAGKLIRVHCDDALADACEFIFHWLVEHSEATSPDAVIRFQDDGNVQIESDHDLPSLPSSFYLPGFDQRVSILSVILLKLIGDLDPSLAIFHGNLLLTKSGKRILILGKSGAGKTTLSQNLMDRYGALSWCEDLVFCSQDGDTIIPYPRAFGCRNCPGKDSRKIGNKTWQRHPGITSEALDRYSNTAHLTLVFLVATHIPTDEIQNKNSQTWATNIDDLTLEKFKEAGLPQADSTDLNSCYRLSWERRLSREERILEEKILIGSGSLILATSAGDVDLSDNFTRPVAPEIKELEFENVLSGIPGYMISPSSEYQKTPSGLRLFNLLPLLDEARFVRLVPGGTPDQTVDCLMSFLG